jgi:GNAT superfamily N-acetyltransferase
MTTNGDVATMKHYGITCESNLTYKYRNHKCNTLQDAINFSKYYHENAKENVVLVNEHSKPLKNPVIIRPIEANDTDIEVAFIDRLSKTTKRYRFLGGVHQVSADLIKKCCNVNFDQTAAFIASTNVDGEERGIGVARYASGSNSNVREMAITIADEWQNKGLSVLLAQQLIDCAKQRDIKQLYSIDLANNTHMRQLAKDIGMNSRRDPGDAHQVIYTLILSD